MFWSSNDVDELIVKRKYGKAIKILRDQLSEEKNVFKLQQLADLLVLEGHEREALHILSKLVEDFAAQGFMTKAIAVLKKIKRIKPDLEGLEEKVTDLIQKRAESERDGDESVSDEGQGIPVSSGEEHNDTITGFSPDLQSSPPNRVDMLAESHSPLFRGFSNVELTAFIRGLDLSVFEPGEIIFTEGEPGATLYVVASGLLRVFVRNENGSNSQVRLMGTGEFFGEISLLTGQVRTATVVSAGHCELLALNISKLTEMAESHPAIPNIIREIARMRHNSPEELSARNKD